MLVGLRGVCRRCASTARTQMPTKPKAQPKRLLTRPVMTSKKVPSTTPPNPAPNEATKPEHAALEASATQGDPQAMQQLGSLRALQNRPAEAFHLFTEASSRGYTRAIYDLAMCHRHGLGTPSNPQTAKTLFEDAAAKGIPEAYMGLAELAQSDGRPDLSVEFLKKAAALGIPEAHRDLAVCYLQGMGVAPNWDAHLEHLAQAVEANLPDAKVALAKLYLSVEDNASEALPLLHSVVELELQRQIHPTSIYNPGDAMCLLASCHLNGIGMARNDRTGASLLREAVLLRNSSAMVQLAECLDSGRGVDKNQDAVVHLLQRAAALNNVQALFALSQHSTPPPPSPPLTHPAQLKSSTRSSFQAEYLWRAGQLEFPEAQFQIGKAFLEAEESGKRLSDGLQVGVGVEWLERAAEWGHEQAMLLVWAVWSEGRTVPQDLQRAHLWLRQLAAIGHVDSMHNLGLALCLDMYRGPPNPDQPRQVEGRQLLTQAAEKGHLGAKSALEVLGPPV
eukprot:c18568_g1_i1.p1 GENE.c18568_g1_i1~~c18568_g1_i1.p1  ORF type:complete len:506 (+),score=100.89 c18568_g1_i1:1639-3156(+)